MFELAATVIHNS